MKTMAAAIDFGTSKIVTIMAESGDYHRCSILGSGTAAYDGFSEDGKWNTPDKLSDAIKSAIAQLEGEAHKPVTELYVGVPGECMRVHIRQSQLTTGPEGRVTLQDASDILKKVVAQLNANQGSVLSYSPAYYQVDDGEPTMTPVGMRGRTLSAKVSVITASLDFMDDIELRLRDMGIKVSGFMPSAMGEAVLLMPPEERDKTVAMVDVGYLHTELMVMQGDAMVDYQVLPVGGGHIAADLAYGLEIPFATAEGVKRAFAFDGSGDIELGEGAGAQRFERPFTTEIITARVDELSDMIRSALEDTPIKPDANAPLYLTGGGISMMRGGREYLARALNRQIKVPSARAGKLNSPPYASALGLIDMVFDKIDMQNGDTGTGPMDKVLDVVYGIGHKIGGIFKRQ
ncbi:MAG: cell division FtsA domain-containing protein [Candidatus Fimadaptatus sp.]|nr:cell division FtsA domain-containing protein [Candidatus Fimadaptatus sp.]